MTFLATLESMLTELARHPDVELRECVLGPTPTPAMAARSRRALRWSDPKAPERLAELPSVRVTWGIRGVDSPVGGFGLRDGAAVVADLLERRASVACADPDSGWLIDGVALDPDSLGREARPFDEYRPSETACLVGVGGRVLAPVVLTRKGTPLPAPRRTIGQYLDSLVAARGLYAIRTLEAGDPVLLGPAFPEAYAASAQWLDEIVAIGLAWSEIRSTLDGGARLSRRSTEPRVPRSSDHGPPRAQMGHSSRQSAGGVYRTTV